MPIRMSEVSKNKTLELFIYGEITSEKWFESDVTPNDINFITGIDAELINVHLNSPGGEVFSGITIGNILRDHRALVSITVEGIAASIASVILQAADERKIYDNAMVMIHNASVFGYGTAAEHRKIADSLDEVNNSVVATYKNKTGLEESIIKELMDAETYMTSKKAFELNFVDTIIGDKVPVAVDENGIVFNNVIVSKKDYPNIYQNKEKIVTYEPEPEVIDYSKYKKQIASNKMKLLLNNIAQNDMKLSKIQTL